MFFFSLHAIVHIRRNMLFTVVFVFLTESYKFNRTFQKIQTAYQRSGFVIRTFSSSCF